MFAHLGSFFLGAITLLAAVAAFSRIATMQGAPEAVKNAFSAMAHLFNGALGQ